MSRKLLLWLTWGLFVIYAFGFAPPNQPDTFALIQNLSTGNFAGINPLIIALFNIMGVIPLLYSCFLYSDGQMQKIPAWFFAIGSFGVGAFALLPYLALRQPNPLFAGEKNGWLKLWDSRLTGGLIAIGAIALLTYGITQGDWADFVQQWQTSRFVHVMSLDFCLLCLLFPFLLADDMTRRGLTDRRIFWAVTLVPLLGALAYVVLRPPLSPEKATPGEPIMQS
ncbi:DUF2834 domain-containing protein [filamentous cyanobacterium CCP1]|nr:DUF2834 domain-containing protein [filamentous cyanobacterium CCP2]PSB61301.1 DUF2834 domain-containing protein [filamentous cyanobacterium CCP1]